MMLGDEVLRVYINLFERAHPDATEVDATFGPPETDPTRPAIQQVHHYHSMFGTRTVVREPWPRMRRKLHFYWTEARERLGMWQWAPTDSTPPLVTL